MDYLKIINNCWKMHQHYVLFLANEETKLNNDDRLKVMNEMSRLTQLIISLKKTSLKRAEKSFIWLLEAPSIQNNIQEKQKN